MPAQAHMRRYTVLDVSRDVAGSFCTKILAELGMEVIKVEPPDGDPLRRVGPFKDGVPHPETSAPFLYLNTGKKSVTLNVLSKRGRRLFDQLLTRSDVLVHSFPAHDSAALKLGYEHLSRVQPGLVQVSLSPFGQSGPYASYKAVDLTPHALSGHMHLTGEEDREPLMPYGNQPQFQQGLNACVATLAALFCRERTGVAQEVDVSGMETGASILENAIGLSSGPHHQDSGEAKIRESTAGVSRKPSSDCKACGCSSKHLCGLTAWNT